MPNSFSNAARERRTPVIASGNREMESLGRVRVPQMEDSGAPESNLLFEYVRTVSRYRWTIAMFTAAGVLASFLINFGSQPYYRARTSLDITSLNGDFMNMHTVAPTGDGGASNEINVQTQIKLLQSETLLERTVERLRLEPHSAVVPRSDLASRLDHMLHISQDGGMAYADLLDDTSKHVTVKPLGVTRLVEITCDSWNAAFAATFCNALTSEFKEADLETRGTESEKTSQWLTRQVADIKVKAEESERKLVAATGGNGLILSQDQTTVGEDRLRQIQTELVRAQADRMEKEAQLNTASVALPGTTPGVMDAPEYRAYQQRLADLRNKVAELVPPLTEENPKVIHLRSQIRDVEAGMASTRALNAGRMRNEYAAAVHRETLLKAAYQTQEGNVSTDLGKAAQVALLRREVESEQQLYQTLLQRAKEAGFASAMQASTVRVVDAAKTPRTAFSPKHGTTAIAGFMVGSLFGVGFAFFKDRNTQVFRLPGDTERYLHMNELGVIPTTEANRIPVVALKNGPLAIGGGELLAPPSAVTLARWNDNFSVVAEAYRSATFSILLSDDASRRSRVYVISSPNSGEGKTTVTSNLGVALSKSSLRVVIVDGDLRKPGMHTALQVANDFGLRNLLRGEMNMEHAPVSTYCKPTTMPNLFVLTSGTGSEEVVELLHSQRLETLIRRLHQNFDVVLIDTPPMLHMADARIFAHHAQGAILILRAGGTSRDQAAKARDLFERDGVRLVGTILNGFDPAKEGQSSYYASYYIYKKQAEANGTSRTSS